MNDSDPPSPPIAERLARAGTDAEADRWAAAYAEDVSELLDALAGERQARDHLRGCLLDATATAAEWAGEPPADRLLGLLSRALGHEVLQDGLEIRAGTAHTARREALTEIQRLAEALRRLGGRPGTDDDVAEWARLVEEVAAEGLRPQPAPGPD
jgi:hypothetical protein